MRGTKPSKTCCLCCCSAVIYVVHRRALDVAVELVDLLKQFVVFEFVFLVRRPEEEQKKKTNTVVVGGLSKGSNTPFAHANLIIQGKLWVGHGEFFGMLI